MTKTKSNRFLSMLLALVMVMSLGSVFCISPVAYADSDGEWAYTVADGKATITAYYGTDKAITVPSKVGGYAVSKVEKLFTNNHKTSITSIRFSEGITALGNGICENCSSLKSVTFPSTLRTIGNDAFSSCTSLTGITIPQMVNSIGDSAFKGCTNLITASLNCGISTVSKNIFIDCTKLASVSLPNTCTSIQENAFSGCSSLTKINMPNSVKEIKTGAFSGCSSLSGTITLPAQVKTIGSGAFRGCSSVTKFIIPNTIRDIEAEAFADCRSLQTVLMGKDLRTLKENVFFNCASLKKIAFGGKYVRLSSALKFNNGITIYYPTSQQSSWADYREMTKVGYSAVDKITVSGSQKLTAGSQTTLKVTSSPNTSVFGKSYYFTSSDPYVATVDSEGVVTGIAGGKTTITVNAITGAEKSITISVTPKKVQELNADTLTTSSAKITWKEAAETNISGYLVYRSTSKKSGFKKVGTTLSASYTDKGLTKGKTYYYKVFAYVTSGSSQIKSADSSVVSVKATSPTPATVSAKKYKSKVAKITWGKSVSAQGYEIYMATSANGKFSKIKTVSSGSTTSFNKTGLTKNKTYFFKVRSFITVSGKKVYSDFTKVVKCTV